MLQSVIIASSNKNSFSHPVDLIFCSDESSRAERMGNSTLKLNPSKSVLLLIDLYKSCSLMGKLPIREQILNLGFLLYSWLLLDLQVKAMPEGPMHNSSWCFICNLTWDRKSWLQYLIPLILPTWTTEMHFTWNCLKNIQNCNWSKM